MSCSRSIYWLYFFYADEILLVSASMNMLQDMLKVCYSVSNDLFLSFNYSKSHCIMIGPKINYTLANLKLNCNYLDWTDKLKYLGITVMSKCLFSVCLDTVRQKYFAAVNALNAHCQDKQRMNI